MHVSRELVIVLYMYGLFVAKTSHSFVEAFQSTAASSSTAAAAAVAATTILRRTHNTSYRSTCSSTPTRRRMATSSSSTTTIDNKKRKYVSDGKDVLESFAVLEDESQTETIHTLILGTMPSDKSYGHDLSEKEIILRGGTGPQNYGASRNTFWNIVSSAFDFQRHQTSYTDQVQILNQHGYAVWDVLKETKRRGSLDQDIVKGSEVPNDLPGYIQTHKNLTRFVFAANSAKEFCKPNVFRSWLQTGQPQQIQSTPRTPLSSSSSSSATAPTELIIAATKFWIRSENLNPETYKITNTIFGKKTYQAVRIVTNATEAAIVSSSPTSTHCTTETPRMVELIAMPSTSPASAALRPPEKEKLWHIACYNYTKGQPPEQYRCPGCCDEHKNNNNTNISGSKQMKKMRHERHWFQDCPYREEWKDSKRNNGGTNNTPTKMERPPQQPITGEDIDPFRWYL